ncbi:serine-rich adhesin for platelets-like [Macrobrachium rosenbergii]|uniref:serine-rich adhesin for platelets-like n=1 Tax=Macrobrachium rosenbergii TaxID=79674 RepID=UPI0034D4F177
MFGWAKKLSAIFPSRDCDQDPLTKAEVEQEKQADLEVNQNPVKEGELSIPEPEIAHEKRTPSHLRKLPQFLGISYDGITPDIKIRSRSKSPRPSIASNQAERVVTNSPENISLNNSCQSSGIPGAYPQEESSSVRTQWYVHLNNESREESNLSAEQHVAPDHHDSSDRHSTPERYYTPSSSRPTSIKSSNTELSDGTAKPSISEKVFGEVLKGFDKLGDIRSLVFSRDTRDLNTKENSKERHIVDGNKSVVNSSSSGVGSSNRSWTKQEDGDVMKAQIAPSTQNGEDTGNIKINNSTISQSGSSPKNDPFNSNSESYLLGQPTVTQTANHRVSRTKDENITSKLTPRTSSSTAITKPKTLDTALLTKELPAGEQHIQSPTAHKATEKSPLHQAKDLLTGDGSTLLSPSLVQRIAKEGSGQPRIEESLSLLEIQHPHSDSFEDALLSFEKVVEVFPCSSDSSHKGKSHLPSISSLDPPESKSQSVSFSSNPEVTVQSFHAPSTTLPEDVGQFPYFSPGNLSSDVIHPSFSVHNSSHGNHVVSCPSQNIHCKTAIQSSCPSQSNFCVNEVPPAHSTPSRLTKDEIHLTSKDIMVPTPMCSLPRKVAQPVVHSQNAQSSEGQNPSPEPLVCSPCDIPKGLNLLPHSKQGNQSKEVIQSSQTGNQSPLLKRYQPSVCQLSVVPESLCSQINQQKDGIQSSLPRHSAQALDINSSLLPFDTSNPKEVDKTSLPSPLNQSVLSSIHSQPGEDHLPPPSSGAQFVVHASLPSLMDEPNDVSQPTLSCQSNKLENGSPLTVSLISSQVPDTNPSSHSSKIHQPRSSSHLSLLSSSNHIEVETKINGQSPVVSQMNETLVASQSVLISQCSELEDKNRSLPSSQIYPLDGGQPLLPSQSNDTKEINQSSPPQSQKPDGSQASLTQINECKEVSQSSLSLQDHQPDGSQPSLSPPSDEMEEIRKSSPSLQSRHTDGCQQLPPVQSDGHKTVSQSSPQSCQTDEGQASTLPQSDQHKSISESSTHKGHQPDGGQLPHPSQSDEPESICLSSLPQSCQLLGGQLSPPPQSDEPENIGQVLQPQRCQPGDSESSPSLQNDEPKSVTQSFPPQSCQSDGDQLSLPFQVDESKSISQPSPLQSDQLVGGRPSLLPQSDEPESVSQSFPPQSCQLDGGQLSLISQKDESKSVSQSLPPQSCQPSLSTKNDEPDSTSESSPLHSHQVDEGDPSLHPQSDESKCMSQSSSPECPPQSNEAESNSQPSPLQSHQPDVGQPTVPQQNGEQKDLSQKLPFLKNDARNDVGHTLPCIQNNEVGANAPSLPSEGNCANVSKSLLINVGLSSNSQCEQTENVGQSFQLSQNNQQKDSSRISSSQTDLLDNVVQQSPSISNKQEGATMISLLKDIHLLNKQLHDTVNSSHSSENKAVDESNLQLSSQNNKQPGITPLSSFSCHPSSRIVRIPQCEFIDSDQGAAQSFNHPSSSLFQEEHHTTELSQDPHKMLVGQSDTRCQSGVPLSMPQEVSGNLSLFHSHKSTENSNQKALTFSSHPPQVGEKIQIPTLSDDKSLIVRSIEDESYPPENISDNGSNLLSLSNVQSSNTELDTPSVQRISKENGNVPLSLGVACDTKISCSNSSNENIVKDSDLETLRLDMPKQQVLIAPPSAGKMQVNEGDFINQNSLAKADTCELGKMNDGSFSEHVLQSENNLEISRASSEKNKMNDRESFDKNTCGTLKKVIDSRNVEEKESQNNGRVTQKETCQKMNLVVEDDIANGGMLPPVVPRRLSHGNVPGLTRKVKSQSSLVTESCDSHLPSSGKNFPPSARKRMEKYQSASVTRLNEIDKMENISVVSLTENSKIPSTEESISPPASLLVPRQKRKCHMIPVAQPLQMQSLPSGPAKVITESTSAELDSKTPSRKAPPRPPAPVNYNVPLVLASRDASVSVPDKSYDRTRCPAETRACQKTSQKPPPAPKAPMKVSLNPFDSEEEEEPEPVLEVKSSLNPFDSEEDEEPALMSKMVKVEASSKKPKKEISLNPFDSEDDDEGKEQEPCLQTVPHTKIPLPPIGYNPFDEDDDEEEENNGKYPSSHCNRNTLGQKSNTLVSSAYQKRNETSSCSRKPTKPASLNPFDEEDEEEESNVMTAPFLRISSSQEHQSLPRNSVTFQEASRDSLPNSEIFIKRKKKRHAPLPPGYGSTDGVPQRQLMYPRVGSSSSLNETFWRQDTRAFGSTLSLFSSKRKPPPRPPLPKWK